MYSRISLLSLLCLCLSNLAQQAWTRSVSVSLNMSLTRTEQDDRNATLTPKLGQEMLQSCMRETEVSMSQLKNFRLSLLFNDNSENELAPGAGNGEEDINNSNNLSDMDTIQVPYLDLKRNEPLQCFTRCLYERLGLVNYDMVLEEAFKLQFQSLMQRLKPELKECKDLNSKNRCEAAYKLHLCYNHLKNLDAEQRLRELLEHTETGSELSDTANEENENDISGMDKENEIINGIQN